jgi:hypothetical protein
MTFKAIVLGSVTYALIVTAYGIVLHYSSSPWHSIFVFVVALAACFMIWAHAARRGSKDMKSSSLYVSAWCVISIVLLLVV